MSKKTKGQMKLLSLVTTSMIILSMVFTYSKFNDFITMKGVYDNARKSVVSSSELFVNSVLRENKKSSLDKLGLFADEIQKSLFEEYGKDLHGLKYDILNPSEHSKLNRVLNSVIGNSYINHANPNNGIFVMTKNNIIWDKHAKSPLPIKIEEIYDNAIDNNAIQNVVDRDFSEDYIILRTTDGETSSNNNLIREIKDIIFRNDLEKLKRYEMLVPVYITETGDIFGVEDSNGVNKVDNFKIILVQKINIYDALQKYDEQILFIEKELNSIDESVKNLALNEVQWMVFSLGYVVFIIIITRFIQNIVTNNIER